VSEDCFGGRGPGIPAEIFQDIYIDSISVRKNIRYPVPRTSYYTRTSVVSGQTSYSWTRYPGMLSMSTGKYVPGILIMRQSGYYGPGILCPGIPCTQWIIRSRDTLSVGMLCPQGYMPMDKTGWGYRVRVHEIMRPRDTLSGDISSAIPLLGILYWLMQYAQRIIIMLQ
jgi:hypothetical protein